jgi:hypothetical protein
MMSLTNEDLQQAESALYAEFATLEREQKRLLGHDYSLARGTTDLMGAWDRWSRVNNAVLNRRLHPLRRPGAPISYRRPGPATL